MDEREERLRKRAHQLWEEEGRPDGRAEMHWVQAREIVALEEGHPEPIEALANLGEFPTLTDQGEMEIPHRPDAEAGTVAGQDREPISEIETVRRTLEVPAKRRGARSPAGDKTGAMSGDKGRRLRD